MKPQYLVFIFMGMFLLNTLVWSQNKCRQEMVFKTSTVGNGKEAISFPLMFFFKNDTLKIANDEIPARSADNLPFLITKKTCNWNADHSAGHAIYKLSVNSKGKVKKPTLTIEIKKRKDNHAI